MSGTMKQSLEPLTTVTFAVATIASIGNGRKSHFWDASWLNGVHPKDIVLSSLTSPEGKIARLQKTWKMITGSLKSTPEAAYLYTILLKFSTIWERLQNVQLVLDTLDTITWKFTSNGSYSASSA
jgi:hypothetical protein